MKHSKAIKTGERKKEKSIDEASFKISFSRNKTQVGKTINLAKRSNIRALGSDSAPVIVGEIIAASYGAGCQLDPRFQGRFHG